MQNLKSVFVVSAALALATAVEVASGQAGTSAQPKVETRATPLLKVNNLTFKDLNRNGVLDPYEDWRLPVEKRVADLVSRMTLEEWLDHFEQAVALDQRIGIDDHH